MDTGTGTGGRDRRGAAAVVVAVVLLGALVAGVAIAYGVTRGSRTAGSAAPLPTEPPLTAATATERPGPARTSPTAPPTAAPTRAPASTAAPRGSAEPTGSPVAERVLGIPADAMLRAEDYGVPAPVEVTTRVGVGALPRTEPNACTRRTAYPTDADRVAARTAGYSTPSLPESGGVLETVVRYRPGRAAETLAGMRRVLAACAGWRDPATGWTHRYRLEGQRFAGDDSLLVRAADTQDGTTREWGPHLAIVRVGDVVITVSSEAGEGTSVAGRAVALARTAVGRFRAS